MENINTREIKRMLDVDDRQAQVYMRACRIVMKHLEEYFNAHGDFDIEEMFESSFTD